MSSHAVNVAKRKAAIVEAVAAFWDREGYGPTRDELAEATGMSLRTVRSHVTALLAEGTLLERPGVHRSLRLF